MGGRAPCRFSSSVHSIARCRYRPLSLPPLVATRCSLMARSVDGASVLLDFPVVGRPLRGGISPIAVKWEKYCYPKDTTISMEQCFARDGCLRQSRVFSSNATIARVFRKLGPFKDGRPGLQGLHPMTATSTDGGVSVTRSKKGVDGPCKDLLHASLAMPSLAVRFRGRPLCFPPCFPLCSLRFFPPCFPLGPPPYFPRGQRWHAFSGNRGRSTN